MVGVRVVGRIVDRVGAISIDRAADARSKQVGDGDKTEVHYCDKIKRGRDWILERFLKRYQSHCIATLKAV